MQTLAKRKYSSININKVDFKASSKGNVIKRGILFIYFLGGTEKKICFSDK